MEIETNVDDIISNIDGKSRKDVKNLVRKAVSAMGDAWEDEVKRIVSDVSDTGEFEESISYKMFEIGDDIGFEGTDGVDYGIRFEFGDEYFPELKPFVNAMIKVQGESDEMFAEVFGDE